MMTVQVRKIIVQVLRVAFVHCRGRSRGGSGARGADAALAGDGERAAARRGGDRDCARVRRAPSRLAARAAASAHRSSRRRQLRGSSVRGGLAR